jgi:predicted flap endonuclease-1-like 5' DNA nuclease
MKALLRTLGMLGIAAVAIYLLRDRLLPPPVIEPAPAPIRGTAPPPTAATADDLTAVAGIGPVYAARLVDSGISSFRQLASADPERIATAAGVRPDAVADWIAQAERLTSS